MLPYRTLLFFALIGLTFCCRPATADDALAEATRLYQSGQWKMAAHAFDRLAQARPRDGEASSTAQLFAGECLVQLGEYQAARQRFEQVRLRCASAKMLAQAQFRLAEIAWFLCEPNASSLLQAFVDQHPHDESTDFAREYLAQIAQSNSSQADFALLDEAVGLQRAGRHDAALAAYHKLLNSEPVQDQLRSEVLRRAAQLHDRLDQVDEAQRLYQQFLAEHLHSERAAEVRIALAWTHSKLDQTSQAAEHFRGVYENFPKSPQAAEAAYWLARHSIDKAGADKEDGEQSTHYVDWLLAREQLASEQPKLWCQALSLKCQLAMAKGQWQEINDLVETVSKDSVAESLPVELDYWAAEAAFRLRKYRLARSRFTALQPQVLGVSDPWTAMVPLRRAQLAARRQQWSEVLELLDGLDRDHPEFEMQHEVDYLRGRALAGRGEMNAAREFYQRVLDNPAAAKTEAATMAGWMIGETYFHQRDYARARLSYQTVVDEASQPEWQARAALQAGKCWELQQDWEQAAIEYGKALERWPQTESQPELASRHRWAESQRTATK